MASDDADLALATSRLIPNLFLLGNPKSGSTFLFSCLRSGPFDPNLLRGPYHASRWKDGAYLVTALGTKKEFNFWGGPGWSWGWDWYVGPPVPLSHWEWRSNTAEPTEERLRVGENGNGEPSSIVDRVCRLNATTQDPAAIRTPAGRRARRRAAAVACRRFPLECFGGAPLVRAGCGLVRPLPSTTGCGGPRQRPCESPKVRMSHAWPLTSEVSPRALAIDPSVNTFLSMPAAAEQLQRYHPRASSLKFLVLIREPLARAVSSARMMQEWRWDKHANISSSLLIDLTRLGSCAEGLAPASRAGGRLALDGSSGLEAHRNPWRRAADELAKASDRSLRRFRECLARGAPLNHVRGSVYAAGVLGWLSAGFAPSSFLFLETERMRRMGAYELLLTIARFASLPTEHLRTLPADIRAACENAATGSSGRILAAATPDSRRQTHAYRALPPAVALPLQEAFKPFNELLSTLVADIAPTLRGVRWMT